MAAYQYIYRVKVGISGGMRGGSGESNLLILVVFPSKLQFGLFVAVDQ
jgi:hypothetical protein